VKLVEGEKGGISSIYREKKIGRLNRIIVTTNLREESR
jgi:hypothetical protein